MNHTDPVSVFGFGGRIKTVLHSVDIKTVGDLLGATPRMLGLLPNLGQKSLLEIHQVLNERAASLLPDYWQRPLPPSFPPQAHHYPKRPPPTRGELLAALERVAGWNGKGDPSDMINQARDALKRATEG